MDERTAKAASAALGEVIGALVVFLLVAGFSFAVAMGIAWAVTSIWPTIPFWPAAVGIFLLSSLLQRPSKK